jgi:predicted dehydrogenase
VATTADFALEIFTPIGEKYGCEGLIDSIESGELVLDIRPQTMSPVRLAVVGCGKIAEQCQIPAVLSASNVELAAVADSNAERLEFIVRLFSLSCLATTSAADLNGKVDGVLLLLPNHLHHPLGCKFMQDGIHVLCEKPLANTTEEANRMCELAEAMGVILAVGYVRRFQPNVQLMKRLLSTGFLGRLERFEYESGTAGGWAPVSSYNLHREQAGGGVLMANGCHFLDLMIYWFGYPCGVKFSDDSHGGMEANCSAIFTFGDGLRGEVTLSKTHQLRNCFRLYGEQGCIDMTDSQCLSLTYIPRDQPDLRYEISTQDRPTAFSDVKLFQLQIEDFARAIEHGLQPRVTGRQALAAASLIEECYRVRTPMNEPWVFESLTKLTGSYEGSIRDS